MEDQPAIIKQLEDRVGEALRDRQLAVAAGRRSEMSSAVEEYDRLVKDPATPLGIRYLALHCIAGQEGFYRVLGAKQEMLPALSAAMGEMSAPEVVAAIDQLKKTYPLIYKSDSRFIEQQIDRVIEQQIDRVTQIPDPAQNTTTPVVSPFQSITSEPEPPKEEQKTPPKVKVKLPDADELRPSVPADTSWLERDSAYYGPVRSMPPSTPGPIEPVTTSVVVDGSKNALIIGGGMVAGAMIFSAAIVSQIGKPSVWQSGSSQPSLTVSAVISQGEAKQLIERWLEAKKTVFAPPYNQQLGLQLTTGKALSDKVQGPSSDGTPYSSLEWLRKYGFHYKYGVQSIEEIKKFEVNGDEANVEIQLLEEASLYNQNGILQPKSSGLDRKIVRYSLRRDNGVWKIASYNNVGNGKRQS